MSSAGEEAIDLARSVGVFLDPAQELAVLVILAEAENGNWAAFETAVLEARQNGKGEILLVLELAGLFLLGEMLLLHSAHEFKTSKEAFLRIKGVIEGAPHLSRLVKQFRQSNEDTSVELMSGARLRFMARSRQSGRGFSAQRLLVDEAQILSHASMGALMPTLSAQKNPQINYFGTVPRDEDCSEQWDDVRDRGRRGDDPYLAWMEWNIGTECPDLDDLDAWVAANPALGRRISVDFVAKERASLSDADFARERLSIWPDASTTGRPFWLFVPEADWTACLSETPLTEEGWLTGPVDIAIEVSFDRSRSSIGSAGTLADGSIGLHVMMAGEGTGWVVPHVVALKGNQDKPVGRVVIDKNSPAASLIEPLTAAGIEVTEASYADVKAMTGGLHDVIVRHETSHRGQPELTAAVGHASKRTSSDVELIDRKTGVDVGPLLACGLAHWIHSQAPVMATPGDFLVV